MEFLKKEVSYKREREINCETKMHYYLSFLSLFVELSKIEIHKVGKPPKVTDCNSLNYNNLIWWHSIMQEITVIVSIGKVIQM